MLLSNKSRTTPATQTELNAFNPIIQLDPIAPELIPAIDFSNYIDPALTLTTGNQANQTGIKGYLSQEAIDQLFTKAGAGDLKLASIYSNGATNTILGTALQAIVSNNGNSYATIPLAVVTLQGADAVIGNTATAPTYTVNITGGFVTSLTQTSAGTNLTQIPLITFNNTGTGGSGATAYIQLTNNWFDDKLINPNGGALTKVISDLTNNYYNKTQVDGFSLNGATAIQIDDDFDKVMLALQNSNVVPTLTSPLYIGSGWTLANNSNASGTYVSPKDLGLANSAVAKNPAPNGDAPGVFSWTASSGSTTQVSSKLFKTASCFAGVATRTTKFRVRFPTPQTGSGLTAWSSPNDAVYIGLESVDISGNGTAIVYFLLTPSVFGTAANNAVTVTGASTINFSILGLNRERWNLFEIRITGGGTTVNFYLNGTNIASLGSLALSGAYLQPFINLSPQSTGGSLLICPTAVDIVRDYIVLPTSRTI